MSKLNDSRMSKYSKPKSKASQSSVKGSDSFMRNDMNSSYDEVKTPDRNL